MTLKELKQMVTEEYNRYLAEQDAGAFDAPAMGDPMVNVSGDDVDLAGGDPETTLRQIYDMLKAYFESGATAITPAAPAAPAGDDADMGMEPPEEPEASDDEKDADDDVSEEKEDDKKKDKKEGKKDKEDLKERFQKLANIVKG
tara:strand:- start:51 stop:482 length:432 start_codon:yes stop_codon:yes gene_type:complete